MIKYKGVKLNLGGDEYVVPPLTLGALEVMQDRIAAVHSNGFTKDSIAAIIDCAHASMKRNYPELTREAVAEMLDLENMMEVFDSVMDVSGVKRKKQEEAPGESIGAPSTLTSAPQPDGLGITSEN